ncbi:hypothetical protein EXN66_Car017182 [Channa argus]|uniref:Uncharacterized protein n=1 Tax=Channa argus TaxID=215402 RepID=A0A6G1QGC7_CHAAH|nr:hypothetical protein EXN66_Car017182 [Channa argus]
MKKKITDQHINGNGYKNISKQLNFPLTKVANMLKKLNDSRSVDHLPGCDHKRKCDPRLNKRVLMENKNPKDKEELFVQRQLSKKRTMYPL